MSLVGPVERGKKLQVQAPCNTVGFPFIDWTWANLQELNGSSSIRSPGVRNDGSHPNNMTVRIGAQVGLTDRSRLAELLWLKS